MRSPSSLEGDDSFEVVEAGHVVSVKSGRYE